MNYSDHAHGNGTVEAYQAGVLLHPFESGWGLQYLASVGGKDQ